MQGVVQSLSTDIWY